MSDLPLEIRTPRLRLPVITLAEAADMSAGRRRPEWHGDYPRRDDLDAVAGLAVEDPWGPRHIVRAFDNLYVGSIGFFGPPHPGDDEVPETEVGFGLVAEARGHGAVTEALGGMLAEADRLGVRVRASVEPENKASLRVLAKCGFTQLRGATPEGHLVMVRPLP